MSELGLVILDSGGYPSGGSLTSSLKVPSRSTYDYPTRTSGYTGSGFAPARKSGYLNDPEEEKHQAYRRKESGVSDATRGSSSFKGGASSGSDIGACGLSNIGNTCFMYASAHNGRNSMLQCLFSTPLLNDFFLKGGFKVNPTSRLKGHLAHAYADLLGETVGRTSSRYGSVTPSELKRCVSKFAPQFVGYGQHDSQEFLRFLLEGLSEDVNRVSHKPKYKELDYDDLPEGEQARRWWEYSVSREDSIVTDLFQGQLMSKITCETCGFATYAFDIFCDLSLPIPRRIGYY